MQEAKEVGLPFQWEEKLVPCAGRLERSITFKYRKKCPNLTEKPRDILKYYFYLSDYQKLGNTPW